MDNKELNSEEIIELIQVIFIGLDKKGYTDIAKEIEKKYKVDRGINDPKRELFYSKKLMTELLDDISKYFRLLKENALKQRKIVLDIVLFFKEELDIVVDDIRIDKYSQDLVNIEFNLIKIEGVEEHLNSIIQEATTQGIYIK